MKLLIITHVSHKCKNNSYWAYAPYVSEMNLWFKFVDEVHVLAPLTNIQPTEIDASYQHQALFFEEVSSFNLINSVNIWGTIKKLPAILFRIYKAMQTADHIHLRCPGNMGLLGTIVQILFPKKSKTAKYAGNWDPKSKQPWSYKLQKWILSNTFITKNMQVLVYGEWPNQTKNIKPFFTATYSEKELYERHSERSEAIFSKGQIASSVPPRNDETERHPQLDLGSPELEYNKQRLKNNKFDDILKFIFVGTLTKNKRPLLCVEVVQQLKQQGYQVQIELYGEGPERHEIENYILDYNLQQEVILKGNVSKEELKVAYKYNHFLLFFSQSEGWPKAVAEAMFWGCVPITTAVSCVPYMLGSSIRGTLVEADKSVIIAAVENYVNHPEIYKEHAQQAMDWSRQFTLEKLEEEILKLLEV